MDAVERVIAQLPGGDRVVIGIAGAPGAGKSTFAAALAAHLNGIGHATHVLPMDGFHLPQSRLVELGRRDRMGAPDTFDVDGFVDLLARVRATPHQGVRAPLFDRDREEAVPGALLIEHAARIIVVDGNYLLHGSGGWEQVRPLLDLAVFVRVDDETRRDRLIARHIVHGKTEESARAWALGPDERNAVAIADDADRADLVLELD